MAESKLKSGDEDGKNLESINRRCSLSLILSAIAGTATAFSVSSAPLEAFDALAIPVEAAQSESALKAEDEGKLPAITGRVFLDVAIDGVPVGRIIVGLYGQDVPLASSRFAEIARGKGGVSYRRKEFMRVTPHYVQNAGLRKFSLTGSPSDAVSFPGGETAAELLKEKETLSSQSGGDQLKCTAGAVSLVVYDPTVPPPKQKLVAAGGRLVTLEEEQRPAPNGTEFCIAVVDAPELEETNLVVGRVVEGWDVVLALSRLPAVKENSNSPYFRVAKLIGDTRAVVAERGFNRPYQKVVISSSGVI